MEKMIITAENIEKTTFTNELSITQEDDCKVIDVTTTFKSKKIMGCYKEEIYDEFKIGYACLKICDKCQFQFQFKGQTIEMLFFLEGTKLIELEGGPLNYCYNENIISYSTSQTLFQVQNGNLSFMRVNFSPSFLSKFLPCGQKLTDFRKKIESRSSATLQQQESTLHPEISYIIKEIQQSQRKGVYRKIYIHAKVLQLLLLQFDQGNYLPKNKLIKKEQEKDKILKIRDYILSHYTEPQTLEELSKKFGTNDFTLKKGFKSVVGVTVFNYIADLKMTKAKELLVGQGLPVAEVAEIIGYKNPQHFSTAFKKKFGITPSKLYCFLK